MDPNQINQRFTEKVVTEDKFNWVMIGKFALVFVVLAIFWQWVNSPMIVTVTGVGEVNVPATNATVTFNISASDVTPEAAITNISGKADAIRQVVITAGVAEEDISQSQITVLPSSLVTPGTTGFQSSITMSAKTIHVSNVSSLITQLYASGAYAVSQPTLSVENEQTLDAEAYNSAVKDAKAKAGRIGMQNWKFIRKIVSINSQSSGTTSTATSKADVVTGSKNAIAAQNGVFKIVEAVSVSYKMW
jgi:uncharacterized protein YggE